MVFVFFKFSKGNEVYFSGTLASIVVAEFLFTRTAFDIGIVAQCAEILPKMTGGGAMQTLRMTHIHRKRFNGFLEVAITGTETIAQIRTLIAAKTGLRVSHVSYRGNYLSKSVRIAHLLPEFMSNSTTEDEPPRFAVHTKTLAGKELVVRTLTGKLLVIFLPLNTGTVKDLKEEIRDLEDIPLDQLRLLFTGKLLEDDKKLSDYKIGQHSIIDQIEPVKTMDSGLYVSDNVDAEEELSCGVKVDFLDFGSDWRVAAPGLNVEGLCQNTECVAYAKMVICNKGFSVFNFALMEGTCPMCKHSFDALTCAFTSCVWMYEGRAKTIAPVRVCDLRSTWIEAGNRYELFHLQEGDDDMVMQWESLIVTAKKLATTRKLSRLSRPSAECSICYEGFRMTNPSNSPSTHAAQFHAAAAVDCMHPFHLECVTLWKSHGGTSCPTCQGSIV